MRRQRVDIPLGRTESDRAPGRTGQADVDCPSLTALQAGQYRQRRKHASSRIGDGIAGEQHVDIVAGHQTASDGGKTKTPTASAGSAAFNCA